MADPTLADEDDVCHLLLLDDEELIGNSNLIPANKDSNEGVDHVMSKKSNDDLISNQSNTDSDLETREFSKAFG